MSSGVVLYVAGLLVALVSGYVMRALTDDGNPLGVIREGMRK